MNRQNFAQVRLTIEFAFRIRPCDANCDTTINKLFHQRTQCSIIINITDIKNIVGDKIIQILQENFLITALPLFVDQINKFNSSL